LPDEKQIVVDPGHGGSDPGAVGHNLIERDINYTVALGVKRRIDAYYADCTVFQDNSTDSDLILAVAYANNINADYFLSIHVNAAADPSANGFESFVQPGTSEETKRIRSIIHTSVAQFLYGEGIQDRGMKEKDLYVTRETNMSACLLEIAFISNESDAQKLSDPNFLDRLSNAIAWGTVQALELERRGGVDEYLKTVSNLEIQVRELRQELRRIANTCMKWV
jgi:N-acetylmuramoyl-L-alanine amidase